MPKAYHITLKSQMTKKRTLINETSPRQRFNEKMTTPYLDYDKAMKRT